MFAFCQGSSHPARLTESQATRPARPSAGDRVVVTWAGRDGKTSYGRAASYDVYRSETLPMDTTGDAQSATTSTSRRSTA
ncbi:hypothetical protein AB0P36_23640 [Streptomyces flavidovirens]|uniref:hypothetical protein n=1 Tax=Streptomyces flavidovirens TaxID=67298 RepID=UPI003446D7A5